MRRVGQVLEVRAAARELIDAVYSCLPVSLRNVVHRARLRIHPGQLTAQDWARRPALNAEQYWQSIDQPHRRILIEQLRSFGTPVSVLELGSHSGPNLRLAASEFPTARVGGIEINPAVVARARELLRGDDLGRVELTVGSVADVLARLARDSEDLLFSCFALAYIPPAQLEGVLRDALRVARLGLVLLEPQARGRRGALMRETAGWRHDYLATLMALGVEPSATRMIEVLDAAPLDGCLVADLRPD